MNDKVGTIYKTDDYKRFKFLNENRELNVASLKRIGRSIDEHGFLLNPIKVNEKYEIIDGQHRFQALMDRGLPIIYYQENGADEHQCRILNTNQCNWKAADYIHSYAESGIQSYKWLQELTKRYEDVSLVGIMAAIDMTGVAMRNTTALRGGRFTMTDADYTNTMRRLDFYRQVNDAMQSKASFARLDYKVAALSFCHESRIISDKRMVEKVTANWNRPDMLNPCVTLDQCVSELSKIYNYRNREKVLIDYEYKKWRMAGQKDEKHNRRGTERNSRKAQAMGLRI